MIVRWGDKLIEELAYRRCVIFTGSGLSASTKDKDDNSPPTWGAFINGFIKHLEAKGCSAGEVTFIKKKLEENNYLMALQCIKENYDSGDYSKYLTDTFRLPNQIPSEGYKAIRDIDSKIVVTTNFDHLYENICNAATTVSANYYDLSKITANLKSPLNLVIKAHGSIQDVDKMIFSGTQYFKSRRDYPDFYRILEAMFLTHTVLFIGYSMNDPDIQLVLEGLASIKSASTPHYILTQKDDIPKSIRKYWSEAYNLNLIEYEGTNYENFISSIELLRDEINDFRSDRGMA